MSEASVTKGHHPQLEMMQSGMAIRKGFRSGVCSSCVVATQQLNLSAEISLIERPTKSLNEVNKRKDKGRIERRCAMAARNCTFNVPQKTNQLDQDVSAVPNSQDSKVQDQHLLWTVLTPNTITLTQRALAELQAIEDAYLEISKLRSTYWSNPKLVRHLARLDENGGNTGNITRRILHSQNTELMMDIVQELRNVMHALQSLKEIERDAVMVIHKMGQARAIASGKAFCEPQTLALYAFSSEPPKCKEIEALDSFLVRDFMRGLNGRIRASTSDQDMEELETHKGFFTAVRKVNDHLKPTILQLVTRILDNCAEFRLLDTSAEALSKDATKPLSQVLTEESQRRVRRGASSGSSQTDSQLSLVSSDSDATSSDSDTDSDATIDSDSDCVSSPKGAFCPSFRSFDFDESEAEVVQEVPLLITIEDLRTLWANDQKLDQIGSALYRQYIQ